MQAGVAALALNVTLRSYGASLQHSFFALSLTRTAPPASRIWMGTTPSNEPKYWPDCDRAGNQLVGARLAIVVPSAFVGWDGQAGAAYALKS
jgi:hypothetical protein